MSIICNDVGEGGAALFDRRHGHQIISKKLKWLRIPLSGQQKIDFNLNLNLTNKTFNGFSTPKLSE